MNEELEALELLVKSPGWLLVVEMATKEQALLKGQHLAKAADDTNDLAALHKLRQVVAAEQVLERFLHRPHERIKALRGQAQRELVPQGHTRGGL